MNIISMLDEKNSIKSLEEHHYYLFHEEFNNASVAEAMRFILERNLMETPPKLMKLIINSPGGDVASAFALIDTIKGSKIPIYTYGLGQISSCGLLTFIAGTKGHRYITNNTVILSHQFFWGTVGKEHELMAAVREFDNTSKRIIDHYMKCTGLTAEEIKKYLLPPEDVWLISEEALKYGLADKICTFY
jgi:ATP-dependent Clp protease protease subunit